MVVLSGVLCASVGFCYEARTSTLQSRYLSRVASELEFELSDGPSDRVRFPGPGPYDIRLGYHRMPQLLASADSQGFRITSQARVSQRFAELVDQGLFPVYHEKSRAGLTLLGTAGDTLLALRTPDRAFPAFSAIPDVVVASLLFIESREFLDPDHPRRNPAVEWDRLVSAFGDLALRAMGQERNVPGASTIATQLEKFRHSPDGITRGPRDKLVQMATASIRAYLDGRETLDAQRRIVLDYLNSVPMAAIAGHGEVTGLGDGLWAWYASELDEVSDLLAASPGDGDVPAEAGVAYRQVLSLLLAHRRPTYYLTNPAGREDLASLTASYLDLLEASGWVSSRLLASAREVETSPRARAPDRMRVSFVERKAANRARASLTSLLGVEQLYELDRLDLTARSTIRKPLQDSVTALFARLHDPEVVRAAGLSQPRLLDRGDPSRVTYAFTLFERSPHGNLLRATTDNLDAPFSFNESARIELGSTAKLRTLVSYLEAVARLHDEWRSDRADAVEVRTSPQDPLSRWAAGHLANRPDASLRELLAAAMERRYSANPGERFVTGGGTQAFSNFDATFDGRALTVTEGFRHSVNLVFVRMMRDLVGFHTYRLPGSTARVLEDVTALERADVLSRFADREGSEFIRQFHRRYEGHTDGTAVVRELVNGRRFSALQMAWAYRTVRPDATVEEFSDVLRTHLPERAVTSRDLTDVYRRTDPTPHALSDLGFLARVHPLELWVVRFRLERPQGSLAEALSASADARQEVYGWLFRTSRRNAQDRRIRFMLELEAFEAIRQSWSRLGYPFQNLVPSLGTSIGSSGDRPSSLAELMGILLNDGVRVPAVITEELRFAAGTPFETVMQRRPVTGERVLAPEVAAVARDALEDVVQTGTAVRGRGAVVAPGGGELPVGGKTGTGDNRFRIFGPGGREVESRPVNRTSAFVFFVADRYFGVVTAYVQGPEAAGYGFTSSLPLQVFRMIGPWIAENVPGPLVADEPIGS